MKKILMLLVLMGVVVSPLAFAEEVAAPAAAPAAAADVAAKVKVYQCPMKDYTGKEAGKCPKCGMTLEEKEMTAAEAEAALKPAPVPAEEKKAPAA